MLWEGAAADMMTDKVIVAVFTALIVCGSLSTFELVFFFLTSYSASMLRVKE